MQNIVKAQFDRQAENFDAWSVQSNREYLSRYYEFCRLAADDTLLDVACGTGEFALFAAPQVKRAVGVDISDGMLDIGRQHAASRSVENVTFVCHDVMALPLYDQTFTMVTCRNALHHMPGHDTVVNEMARCLKKGGRISTLDIVAYPQRRLDHFFEKLDKLIDASHHKTLNKQQRLDHFRRPGMTIVDTLEVQVDLNFPEYLRHAKSSEESRADIERHVQSGLDDPEIGAYFTRNGDELFFKRDVFLVLGQV